MARQRLKEVRLELIVGAFVFIVFLMLGAFTIMLTRENIFRKKYPVSVMFKEISTLREGDKVVVRGMPVGKIKELDLKPDSIKVICSLDVPIIIHENYKAKIVSTSILGGKALQIDQGTTNYPIVPEGTRLKGTDPVDLVDEASEAVAQIRRALDEGHILQNVQESAQSLRDITQKISNGEGLLGRLINDPEMAGDFKAISAQLKEVAGRIERSEGTLGKLLSADDTLYADLSNTVASIRTISGRIERGEGTLGRLMGPDDTLYRDLEASASSIKAIAARLEKGEGTLGKLLSSDDSLYQDLSNTVAALRSTAQKIDNGTGTIGKLVNEDAVYKDLKTTIQELKALVEDYRETSPVVSFGTILVGAL
jgi:phospholipid/cholesterol/gamma-HCH transport system substrate-binding protein